MITQVGVPSKYKFYDEAYPEDWLEVNLQGPCEGGVYISMKTQGNRKPMIIGIRDKNHLEQLVATLDKALVENF